MDLSTFVCWLVIFLCTFSGPVLVLAVAIVRLAEATREPEPTPDPADWWKEEE
jgi:hypothetical protein